uniref:Uncharacterized protein n=1 Tax=Romanomermis culicivorax TaxID=13658 RepID=A0A915K351_ROMCU
MKQVQTQKPSRAIHVKAGDQNDNSATNQKIGPSGQQELRPALSFSTNTISTAPSSSSTLKDQRLDLHLMGKGTVDRSLTPWAIAFGIQRPATNT